LGGNQSLESQGASRDKTVLGHKSRKHERHHSEQTEARSFLSQGVSEESLKETPKTRPKREKDEKENVQEVNDDGAPMQKSASRSS